MTPSPKKSFYSHFNHFSDTMILPEAKIILSMAAKPKEWNATDARFRDTKQKEYENRGLFDAESKSNEILDQFIQKMKKERSHFDFNRFKAKFLGKDYADTDKPNTLLGFTYWYAIHL